MADYLSDYGVKDQKRETRNKRIVLAVVGLALFGGIFYYFARTWTEERTVERFVSLLKAQDFKGGYALWGCTDQTPCRDYNFGRFMEDWGPKSPYGNPSDISTTMAEPCGNAVWITIKTPKSEELGLAVDGETRMISFTPAARCPGKLRLREFPSRLWRYLRSEP